MGIKGWTCACFKVEGEGRVCNCEEGGGVDAEKEDGCAVCEQEEVVEEGRRHRSPINTSSVPLPLSRTSFSCKKLLPTLFISLSPAVTV